MFCNIKGKKHQLSAFRNVEVYVAKVDLCVSKVEVYAANIEVYVANIEVYVFSIEVYPPQRNNTSLPPSIPHEQGDVEVWKGCM